MIRFEAPNDRCDRITYGVALHPVAELEKTRLDFPISGDQLARERNEESTISLQR